MTYGEPARTTSRRIRIRRIRVAGLLAAIAAIAALGSQLLASSSSTAASPIDVLRNAPRGLRSEHRGALGEADGAVPDGTTVFDDEIPGVANLDPALLGALREAATDAADDGVAFFVDSGWRSPEYQTQLLRGTPAAIDEELDAVVRGISCSLAQGAEKSWIKVGYTRNLVIEDRRAVGDGTVSLAERTPVLTAKTTVLTAKTTLLTAKTTVLTAR